jgi:Bacteriodetes cell division protein (FtsL-like)
MDSKKKIREKSITQKKGQKNLQGYKWVVKNIPFFLFLALLAVLYIYNGHCADKLVRKINVTEKKIRELGYEYKTIKSEVIFRSKASELVKAVEPLGLKELVEPPVVLTAPPILPPVSGEGK